ncbi:MAG: hydroxymethylbilane synthase [Aestuariivirgaceae bacterium]|nr:hydroxymethylbilane synthase [Aestuariivirgaceae bacterium]
MQTPFLRIGTRGSKLALFQAHLARRLLAAAHGVDEADIAVEIIRTTGDRVQDRPLSEIGGKGLFTKEIEEALAEGVIDLAVHSMKDMAAVLPEGLVIAAVLEREDARDAFLSPVAANIDLLPPGARVGCSSVRRAAQLLRKRPDVRILPFRGNVDTRLRKLHEGEVEATILAVAGLNRLGLQAQITQAISMDEMLPAPAQGVIGIETRENDSRVRDLLAPLHHAATALRLAAERAFLAGIDGSCRTPVAAHAVLSGDQLVLKCEALALDGSAVFTAQRQGRGQDGARMGLEAAQEIRAASSGKLAL